MHEINDHVCVNIDGNWVLGTLVDINHAEGKTLYKVDIGYKVEEAEYIKRFVPISKKDLDHARQSELKLALETLEKLLPNLIPEATVKVECESIAAYMHGWPYGITLDPVCHTYNTLGEVRERLCWQVTEMKFVPGNHFAPDDYEDCQVGEPSSWVLAIVLFIQTIFNSKLKTCWEALADAEYAKEWEQERIQDVD